MQKDEIMQTNRRRMELYAKGLNDKEIADFVGITSDTISKWREKHHLPHRNLKLEKRMVMYLDGLSDSEIAARENSNVQQVSSWRYLHQLPCNKAKRVWEKLDKRFSLLYKRGRGDQEIAKRCNTTTENVKTWRQNTGRSPVKKNRMSVKMADNIKDECVNELEKVHGRQVARRFLTMIWNREEAAVKKITDDEIINLKNRFDDEVYRELLGKRGK
jgi:transcriptional regulator